MSKQDYEYEKAKKKAKKQAVQFRNNRRGKKDQWQTKEN